MADHSEELHLRPTQKSLDDDLAEYQRLMRIARDGQPISTEIYQLQQAVRQRYDRLGREDAERLLDYLSAQHPEPTASAFLGMVLEVAHQLPDSLFQPLLRAAVDETNPSTHRHFVEPAVRAFGFRRVALRLLKYVNDGTYFEKGCAVRWRSEFGQPRMVRNAIILLAAPQH